MKQRASERERERERDLRAGVGEHKKIDLVVAKVDNVGDYIVEEVVVVTCRQEQQWCP